MIDVGACLFVEDEGVRLKAMPVMVLVPFCLCFCSLSLNQPQTDDSKQKVKNYDPLKLKIESHDSIEKKMFYGEESLPTTIYIPLM